MAKKTNENKRAHRATYASDKRTGGYMIRVAGPNSNRFAGKTVPVTTKAGDEHEEQLERLIWSGKDNESGEPVTLYKFKSTPKVEIDDDCAF